MHRSGPAAQTMSSCSCACANSTGNNNGSVANGLNSASNAAAATGTPVPGTCSVCAAEKRAHRGRKTVVRMLGQSVRSLICGQFWSIWHDLPLPVSLV